MKKNRVLSFIFTAGFLISGMYGQTSDDDLFGGSDDDLFADDGIVEMEVQKEDEPTVTSDLRKGILFQNGNVKIGGNFTTTASTLTTVYADDDKSFKDHLYDTTLTPEASAYLTVDARPNQNLRMYTKFGLAYPFTSSADVSFINTKIMGYEVPTSATANVSDYLKMKELFTDFNIAERVFFRFGLHTVTWGTGYFFSPVSDIINTSSIDPEDTDAQVDGALNLRTQIVFPNSQNCLWLYVIPSTDFTSSTTSYARETALAGKAEFVLGGWEFGAGGYWKYENAPKLMATASGSIENLGIFGEAVYQYGSDSEWNSDSTWFDKTHIYQLTAGVSYYWKTPSITLAAQYYYDSNDDDVVHKYFTHGDNLAFVVSFGRIFGTTDVTASIFGMMNYGKTDIPSSYETLLEEYGISSYLNSATFSAMLNYTPIDELTIGAGPYVTCSDFDSAPEVALKLSFTFGGGKF